MEKVTTENVEDLFEKYKLMTLKDFRQKHSDEDWYLLIKSGKIFEVSLKVLLYGKKTNTSEEIIKEFKKIDFNSFDYSNRDEEFKIKMRRWIEDLEEYHDISEAPPLILPLRQQLIALHYLLKFFKKDINEIHADTTKRAELISLVLGKSKDNIRKDLAQYQVNSNRADYFKPEYLKPLHEIFKEIGDKDIIADLEKNLNTTKKESKK